MNSKFKWRFWKCYIQSWLKKNLTDKLQGNAQADTCKKRTLGLWIRMREKTQGRTSVLPVTLSCYPAQLPNWALCCKNVPIFTDICTYLRARLDKRWLAYLDRTVYSLKTSHSNRLRWGKINTTIHLLYVFTFYLQIYVISRDVKITVTKITPF
jgi:hypothetical protein